MLRKGLNVNCSNKFLGWSSKSDMKKNSRSKKCFYSTGNTKVETKCQIPRTVEVTVISQTLNWWGSLYNRQGPSTMKGWRD